MKRKKYKEYIPAPNFEKELYTTPKVASLFSWVEKVPIDEIKIDTNLFPYQNELDFQEVLYILNNFDQELWWPIYVNPDYCLLEGQHRLWVARLLGLKYLDIVILKK